MAEANAQLCEAHDMLLSWSVTCTCIFGKERGAVNQSVKLYAHPHTAGGRHTWEAGTC